MKLYAVLEYRFYPEKYPYPSIPRSTLSETVTLLVLTVERWFKAATDREVRLEYSVDFNS